MASDYRGDGIYDDTDLYDCFRETHAEMVDHPSHIFDRFPVSGADHLHLRICDHFYLWTHQSEANIGDGACDKWYALIANFEQIVIGLSLRYVGPGCNPIPKRHV